MVFSLDECTALRAAVGLCRRSSFCYRRRAASITGLFIEVLLSMRIRLFVVRLRCSAQWYCTQQHELSVSLPRCSNKTRPQ